MPEKRGNAMDYGKYVVSIAFLLSDDCEFLNLGEAPANLDLPLFFMENLKAGCS